MQVIKLIQYSDFSIAACRETRRRQKTVHQKGEKRIFSSAKNNAAQRTESTSESR